MARFRARVKMLDGCAVWPGSKTKGYGTFSVNGQVIYVHRWAYETFVGPIPAGTELDHLCRNPPCAGVTAEGVVLGHLEPVTHRENLRRSLVVMTVGGARMRAKTHCPQGHRYDEVNTYRPPGSQERQCKQCRRVRSRERASG